MKYWYKLEYYLLQKSQIKRLIIIFVATVALIAAGFKFVAIIILKDEIDEELPNIRPQQVHIAFGNKIPDITVMWSTMKDVNESLVVYRENLTITIVKGISTVFMNGGETKLSQWIHRVLLQDLKFNTTYTYKVGSEHAWSNIFCFTTPPAGENNTIRVLLFGDLGTVGSNGRSIPFLIDDIKHQRYDFSIHLGDLAYNIFENNGLVGDTFMNQLEMFTANLPYMIGPGNHESFLNYSHIKKRFSMPGNFQNMFYSFDIGPVHFISINTEVYYNNTDWPANINLDKGEILTQYNWLLQDLDKATTPENRNIRPWIILYGHRPFYCSNENVGDQCSYDYPHRVGIPQYGGLGLEPVFNKYGIDLGIWAHEHSYERFWPIYNKSVYNGSYDNPYVNPKAPVYINTGAAGNREGQDRFVRISPSWSAFRSSDYSYTRLFCYNSTHLYFKQVLVAPVDSTENLTVRFGPSDKIVDSF